MTPTITTDELVQGLEQEGRVQVGEAAQADAHALLQLPQARGATAPIAAAQPGGIAERRVEARLPRRLQEIAPLHGDLDACRQPGQQGLGAVGEEGIDLESGDTMGRAARIPGGGEGAREDAEPEGGIDDGGLSSLSEAEKDEQRAMQPTIRRLEAELRELSIEHTDAR